MAAAKKKAVKKGLRKTTRKPVSKSFKTKEMSVSASSPKVISAKPMGFSPIRSRDLSLSRTKGPLASVWSFILWLVGILVSLAVGFGMIGGTLVVPYIHMVVTAIAGWIVVILTLIGVLLKVIDVASR